MTEPLTAISTWRPVMVAAGFRCQCTGKCGNPHARAEGRCPREHDHYTSKHGRRVRLMAAPADPATPLVEAAGLPPARLRAWCSDCHEAAARAARRSAPEADAPGLFDL